MSLLQKPYADINDFSIVWVKTWTNFEPPYTVWAIFSL